MIELINEPLNDRFFDLVSSCKKDIKLCSPYVKKDIIQNIYDYKKESVKLECVSNFSLPNFYKKSSDLEAFEKIEKQNDLIYNCQMLHAKLYIFDNSKTIITSSNLTSSGFKRNVEYGCYIDNDEIVAKVVADYNKIITSSDNGVITSKNLKDIRSLLNNLPSFKEIEIEFEKVNESILEINDKELLVSKLSKGNKTMFSLIDELSKAEFSLSDIYKIEYIFKRVYPNNNTVRASMRRNLQELRDIGLIKFVGKGKYIKLWK